jgi:secondary thiamine-phosphate synthase enzyme
MIIRKLDINTDQPKQMKDITHLIQNIINEENVQNGIVTVFIPHTIAGVTINENADPDVVHDLLHSFKVISPIRPEFRHLEGNSDAHLLSTLVGADCRVLIENGRLLLGTWQSIWFCEFDGPRNRKVIVGLSEG